MGQLRDRSHTWSLLKSASILQCFILFFDNIVYIAQWCLTLRKYINRVICGLSVEIHKTRGRHRDKLAIYGNSD